MAGEFSFRDDYDSTEKGQPTLNRLGLLIYYL
jgi:hypothetical protein